MDSLVSRWNTGRAKRWSRGGISHRPGSQVIAWKGSITIIVEMKWFVMKTIQVITRYKRNGSVSPARVDAEGGSANRKIHSMPAGSLELRDAQEVEGTHLTQ